MKRLKTEKGWVKDFEEAQRFLGDTEVLLEFYEAGEASESEVLAPLDKAETAIEKLEFRNMLSDEGDDIDRKSVV